MPRYPPPLAGHLNIGMLHTSATDSGTHETYAPCTRRATGRARLRLLGARPRPCAAGAGAHDPAGSCSPATPRAGTSARTGPKGATLVTVDDGRIVDVAHRDLDVVRWALLRVDLTRCRNRGRRLRRASAPTRRPRSTPPAIGCSPRASCCTAPPPRIRPWCATSARRATSCTPRRRLRRRRHDLAGERRGAHPSRTRPRGDAGALRRRRAAGARTRQRRPPAISLRKSRPTAPHCSIAPALLREALGDDHPAPCRPPRARSCSPPELLEQRPQPACSRRSGGGAEEQCDAPAVAHARKLRHLPGAAHRVRSRARPHQPADRAERRGKIHPAQRLLRSAVRHPRPDADGVPLRLRPHAPDGRGRRARRHESGCSAGARGRATR